MCKQVTILPREIDSAWFLHGCDGTWVKFLENEDATVKKKKQRAEEMQRAKEKADADKERAFEAARRGEGQPDGVSNNIWKMACFIIKGEILTDRKRDRRGANASWNGRWAGYSSWNGGNGEPTALFLRPTDTTEGRRDTRT